MSRVQAHAEEMMARHGFLGVLVGTFEQAGREQLIVLLNEGLNPESKVLEIGCGCLRIAYWLIRFLDAGCYHGIEPARQRAKYGLQYLFTSEEARPKRPRFDFNANFDSSVFGAGSISFSQGRSLGRHQP
jgi:hypothetical protein